jgi:glycerophosphoryl diester phosphodiesterase
MMQSIIFQGHRGCRGLLPENTIPAFLEALKYPIDYLELDVCLSKDLDVVVSHEPYMNSLFCSYPTGKLCVKVRRKTLICFSFRMNKFAVLMLVKGEISYFQNKTSTCL